MASTRRQVVTNRKPRTHNTDKPPQRRKFVKRRRESKRAAALPVLELDADEDVTEAVDAAEPFFAEPTPGQPVRPIPRRARPLSTPHQTRAAQNLLDAIGGPSRAAETLRLSGKSKAVRLADMLESSDYASLTFHAKLDSIGLNLVEFTELLLDVKQAKMVARLVMGGEEIAEQMLARATDRFEVHASCRGSGHVLVEDEETGELSMTADECFGCEGSGYVVKAADREDVELYLELVRMKKNQVTVDARKQVNNLTANVYGTSSGDLQSLDGAPDVNSIIKRADEQLLIAPPTKQVTDGSERVPDLVMPEDEVVEAEVLEPATV